ncbi:NUDIX hydrolase [Nafulsella turpanensis]|uniref:NUDIX hydrolase n=1 Tax=Nafulsella turpanensis TaxID=1265690 RepID=UPI00034DA3D8|nr:NUDIX hydrolase [Nafulsella turpanensis]
MNREAITQQLSQYRAFDAEEEAFRSRILKLLQEEPECFHRHLRQGHITGSAWIVNPGGDQVLLLHHRKLDKWLQPGGHADGDENVRRVAEKEAREESGLSSIQILDQTIFDIDIHTIPERRGEAEHLHYDIRFLFTADPKEPLQQNNESKGLAWIAMEEVPSRTAFNRSIMRMIEKTGQYTFSSR